MPFVLILVLFLIDVPLGIGMAIDIHCYSGDLILTSIYVLLHTVHTRQVTYT